MKKHAIIPIFIPHMGCDKSCVFCNQNQITARTKAPSPDDVRATVDEWLSTLGEVETVEIAFYGGSFTLIPVYRQIEYLEIAKEYLDRGLINGIHLSTRPDGINDEILDRLIGCGVKVIELGVQSFSDDVLTQSKRGHDAEAIYAACEAIKRKGLSLGIQLMVGLPGDTLETCILSAKETVRMNPDLARIYPTLVLRDTELMQMYSNGTYTPLSREDAIERTKAIYEILTEAGITIMRVGLKSTDIINSENLGEINYGCYHPAFRQLVESRIARDKIVEAIESSPNQRHITVKSSPMWISNLAGHNGENKDYFKKNYPDVDIQLIADISLLPGEIVFN